ISILKILTVSIHLMIIGMIPSQLKTDHRQEKLAAAPLLFKEVVIRTDGGQLPEKEVWLKWKQSWLRD
ncbi:hypothetical protein Ocin01_19005, partial [Orchesella cincta]